MEEINKDIRLKKEYGAVINDIIETIKTNMKIELARDFSFSFKWNEQDTCINACAKAQNIAQDKYSIEINLYTLIFLENMLDQKIQNINSIDKKNLIHSIIAQILSFTMWHEYYHISFGHCTIAKYGLEFNETTSIKEGSFERQQLEAMCDLSAARKFGVDSFIIFQENKTGEGLIWLFAIIYVYFYELEKIALQKMEHEQGSKYLTYTSEKRTHPFVTFRYEYICYIIEMEIKRVAKSNNIAIDFENIYGQVNTLLELLGYSELMKVHTEHRRNNNYYNRLMAIDLAHLLKDTEKIYIDLSE